MASADLREELNCSICLNVFTNPVMLRCGHNFCMNCIKEVLDSQERSGTYSCPECREHFLERPALHINITLRNIAEHFSVVPEGEVGGISCTYCIHSPVPAAKSCVQCEASLCVDHLRVHVKSPEHVLIEPTSSLDTRKCPAHKRILEYYCYKDSACICVSCRLTGNHKEHDVGPLKEASTNKLTMLMKDLQVLSSKKKESEIQIQGLQDHKTKVEQSAADITKRMANLFKEIKRKLDVLEQTVLSEVTRQKEEISLVVTNLLHHLELENDSLSKKILHFQTLCSETDPLIILQDQETFQGNPGKGAQPYGGNLDEGLISFSLVKGVTHIMSQIQQGICLQPQSEILLNKGTAGNSVIVSKDMKMASFVSGEQNWAPLTSNQFHNNQVLSDTNFSSGRHYWEVKTSKTGNLRIGMAYPSIIRRGDSSLFGHNEKSWCLRRFNSEYFMLHAGKQIQIPFQESSQNFGVYLDYEAGRLSFYALCDPIKHLHTFTATFTEPLHAAISVYNGFVKIRS
ncbi:E3 ubiquitin/ISG15 ligase TRIM25-like [Eleutherodactylus coqui]|uniref:E3 ubiquitin/ISG15 ligase TRIM25-like n=1 Tax=Eleutherodactylus coqui TaxID=57060 RepID=UPI0034627E54